MFGQPDNQTLNDVNGGSTSTPTANVGLTAQTDDNGAATAPVVDPMMSSNYMMTPAVDTTPSAGTTATAVVSPTEPPAATVAPDPMVAATPTSPLLDTTEHDDLLQLKQQALEHLGPMVDHLDQTPEDKFKTIMMMIQASDDQTKLREAFDLAKQITDDKTRAQALLDVINEINYFTQQPKQ